MILLKKDSVLGEEDCQMASRLKLLVLLLSEDRPGFCVSLLPPLQRSGRGMRVIQQCAKLVMFLSVE